MARSISNSAPITTRGRRPHDHAQTAFGELTPFRFLAGILLLVALLAFAFAMISPPTESLRLVDYAVSGALVVCAFALRVFGPRAASGWPLDVALGFGYLLAAAGMVAVPDALGQLVIGFGLVMFGVFAGVFRPFDRLLWHLAVMLGLYGGIMALDPHLPSPVYFLVVAVTTIAVSLMVSVLAGRLREMALHDPLTGVLNRRGLEVMSELVAAQAARSDLPVTAVLVDLDKFKQFNDTSGHMAGDKRLIEIAHAWENHVRGTDLVARFGGDEFAVVLPGATQADIDELVERVRADAKAPFSVGVTTWIPHEDLYVALKRADTGLFQDKVAPRQLQIDDVLGAAGDDPDTDA